MNRLCSTLFLACALCACSFKTSDFVVGDASTGVDSRVDDSFVDDSATNETDDTNVDDSTIDETASDTGDASGIDAHACDDGGLACGSPPACTIPKDDPLHCSSAGSCGVTCDATQFCENGTCHCRPGLVSCSGTCIDIAGDETHCGGCPGATCTGGNHCADGACTGGSTCTGGRTKCSRSCWDLQGDPTHCGSSCSSMKACAADELCIGGSCVKYRPAFGCTSTSGCDCTKVLAGASACPALTGSSDGVPICVAGTFCPMAPWN